MAVISTGSHPKSLWPGVAAFFGAKYDEYPAEYRGCFEVLSSDKAFEEYVKTESFGLAPVKSEGGSVSYDSHTQGYTKRFNHTAYALGYIVTKEEMDDNLYNSVSFDRAELLAFSMRQTRENVAANVLNRADDSNYTGGDGKELIATDHPTLAGNQQNEPTNATDFSETALEDLLILIMKAQNGRGLRISLRGEKLIVPPDLAFEATRVLKSTLQNDTANNAINAVRNMGLLPGGVAVNHYLTDTDQWFVKTNAPRGLTFWERAKVDLSQDNDFDTMNLKAFSYDRFSVGWGDWLGVFGSPGA